jgi:hypothetical protein
VTIKRIHPREIIERSTLALFVAALLGALLATGGCAYLFGVDTSDWATYDTTRTATAQDFTSIAQIEQFYGLSVIVADPVWSESQIVEVFNAQKDTLGAELLQRLVALYRAEGLPTRFVFETPHDQDEAMAGVDTRFATMVVYNAEGSHEALIHETGHLLDFYYQIKGYDVQAQLVKLNGGIAYLGDRWQRLSALPAGLDRVFVTLYAASEPLEDFAETFSFAFRYPDHLYDGFVYEPGVIAAANDPSTPLAEKVAFVLALAQLR